MVDCVNNSNIDTKPIRVLHILGGLNYGGIENFIMNVYRSIDRNKVQFDFLVFNKNGAFEEEIRELGGKIFHLKSVRKIGLFRFRKELDDFFNKHSEYKIIHSHYNQLSGLILESAKKNNICIRIAHSHTSFPHQNIIEKMIKDYSNSKITKCATHLFACSKMSGNWLYGQNDSFTIINNGIDFDRFKYSKEKRSLIRKKYKITNEAILIGNVGRLVPEKNQMFLIDIFYRYHLNNPKSYLMIVGDGRLKQKLVAKVNTLNLNEFVIFVDGTHDTSGFYSAFDCFILPSTHEGLPLSLIEAQCSGLTCIGAKKVVSKESIISDRVICVEDEDIANNWVECIKKCDNSHLCKKLNRSSFDINIIAKQLEEFYIRQINKVTNI